MTIESNGSIATEVSRFYAHHLRLRRDSPPRFVALYRENVQDGWNFVAVFDMENCHDSVRVINAVVRSFHPEKTMMVPADDPECYTMLEFGAEGLSPSEFRKLYRAFERANEAFYATNRHRRFSEGYRALLKKMRGDIRPC